MSVTSFFVYHSRLWVRTYLSHDTRTIAALWLLFTDLQRDQWSRFVTQECEWEWAYRTLTHSRRCVER